MDVKLNRRSFIGGLAGMIAGAFPFTSYGQGTDQEVKAMRPPGRFGDINPNTIYDVCIIGSGFAGAVLGEALARHGVKTVILESGPDPRGNAVDPRFQQLNAFRSIGPIDYPVNTSRFRGVGGTSWLWGGVCTRLHPADLAPNAYAPAGASWPIRYEELEPFYQRAEETLRVRGGPRSKYDPPRSKVYPFPSDRNVGPLQSLLNNAGIIISDMPFSTSVQRKSSFLTDRYGPMVLMTDRHLPDFQKSSSGNFFSEITVTRLLADPSGVVTGAEVRDLDRNVKITRARVFVVACGGLESPRLLLLSRSARFPNGIGNDHDLVGRFFTEHSGKSFAGRVKIGWSSFGFYNLRGFSYQYYEQFKKLGLGGMRLAFDLDPGIDKSDIMAVNLSKMVKGIFTPSLGITIGFEIKPSPENRVTLDVKAKDYFGNAIGNLYMRESDDDARTLDSGTEIVRKIIPALKLENVEELPRNPWAHHHMGTCRMGDNPRTSVVDRNLQVHGMKNLFVAGSSVFVTSGTAHPTLTLTALSLRLSEFLRTQLRDGAFSSLSAIRRAALRGANVSA